MSPKWITGTVAAALVVAVAIFAAVGGFDGARASAHTSPASTTSSASTTSAGSADPTAAVLRWGHDALAAKGAGLGHHHHRHHQGQGGVGAQGGPGAGTSPSTALTASPGGTSTPTGVPGVPGKVVQIATSNAASYALTSTGEVYAWGKGKQGELGDGSANLPRNTNSAVKVQFPAGVKIASLPNPVPFDGGMAITTTGAVYGWGNDKGHQFCQSSTTPIDTPVRIPVSDVSLAVGALTHTMYDSDGHIVSCGLGRNGQLGNGTSGASADSATPVAVKGLPSGKVTALTSAWGNAGVVEADGSYYDWGYNQAGQDGNGTTALQTTATKVALPDGVSQASEGGSIAANGQTMVILRNGQLWEWGNNEFGQLGDGQTTSRTSPFELSEPRGVHFVKVNSGGDTNYALSQTGELCAWGHNNWGQVGDGSESGRVLTPHRDGITLTQVSSTASEVAGLRASGSAG